MECGAEMTPAEHHLLSVLTWHHVKESDLCWVSATRLARDSRLSERQVRTLMAGLQRKGWLVLVTPAASKTPPQYRLKLPNVPLQPLHPARSRPAAIAPQNGSLPLQPLHPTPAAIAPHGVQNRYLTPAAISPNPFLNTVYDGSETSDARASFPDGPRAESPKPQTSILSSSVPARSPAQLELDRLAEIQRRRKQAAFIAEHGKLPDPD